jgi:hypothetical protein
MTTVLITAKTATHSWAFGWDALVAIGTLTLALVTVGLGLAALLGNRTSRRALDVAQAELQAATLPLLEAVPAEGGRARDYPPELVDYRGLGAREPGQWRYRDEVDVRGESGGVFLSVPFRNVGTGIALIGGPRPQALSVPDLMWTVGECSRPLIPSGQYARLSFRLQGLREEAYAEVFYSDVSGNQTARLRLYLRGERDVPTGQMFWTVHGTALYTDGVAVPFAISGDSRVAEPQPSGAQHAD